MKKKIKKLIDSFLPKKEITMKKDPNAEAKEFASLVLKEVFSLIVREGRDKGDDFKLRATMTILASFLSTVIYNTLRASANKNPTNQDKVFEDYYVLKTAIENSISSGFESAFNEFSGKSVDYTTQIRPIPDPVNKLAC